MKKITITERILKRPITTLMLSGLVMLFGIYALTQLKITLLPPFNIPILAISSGYQNVAPQDMSRIIVEPLESAISGVEGIDDVDSNIRKGNAFIILRMQGGSDIRRAELKVREEIDRIRNEIPREASEPVIFQFDPENRPIMQLSLEAENRGLDELRQYAVDIIEPNFERLEGVAAADTRGGLQRTIYINLRPSALKQHNLIPQDIEQAIRSNNVQLPVGNILSERDSYSVRAISMYTEVDQISETIIKMDESGVPLRVKDVAEVDNGYAEITTIVEVNGKNSVNIEIQKKSDANTLDVTQAVEKAIPQIMEQLPGGMNIQILSNSGSFIESSIDNLSLSALQALVVVILILLLFMGGWRISFVVAMSIPISMAATFVAMYFTGITLNIISITGLALAIGLLVDNSIVVSESIANKLEEGHSKFDAALLGTNEVVTALLGATLTTLGVFIPILGVDGFAGQIARDLALTISISIVISFLASIIVIPVLASKLLSKEEFQRKGGTFKAMHLLENGYQSSLRWVLNHKWIPVLFIIAVMGGIYGFNKMLHSEFFPSSEELEVDIDIELPTGSKLVNTAQVVRGFSDLIQGMQPVENVVTEIGQQGFLTETNRGEITVTLVPVEERDISTEDFSIKLKEMLKVPGVDVRVSGTGGGFGGFNPGMRLSIIGPEIDRLLAISDQIEERLTTDPNIISVNNARTDPTPELHYMVDRQRIARMNTSLSQVANALKSQARGTLVGQFREDGREIPIEVRARKDAIQSRTDLGNISVHQIDGTQIPVSAVGDFVPVEGVNRISRRNGEVVLDISIQFKGETSEYREKITEMLQQNVVLPDGYRYEFTGSSRNFDESAGELFLALLFALFLTYMVMASQFENLRDPFVVMFTIPLAFFGSQAVLLITGTALSVPAIIGVVILVGIVVNNGIVLVDYIHQQAAAFEGTDEYAEKFLYAARRRMRPILLTALTTICSMIPLALEIGSGSETWSPLAKSVIGGLVFSTVLSLYIIPVLTILMKKERRSAKF